MSVIIIDKATRALSAAQAAASAQGVIVNAGK